MLFQDIVKTIKFLKINIIYKNTNTNNNNNYAMRLNAISCLGY
jgi:hypothetical protein